MELRRISFYLLATVAVSVSVFPDKVMAQISSDGTLSTTVTTDDAVNFLIENGDRSGSNLFHSFLEFSIPNLGSAYFNNATDISNIFSRVTGGNISDIQGLIRANGTANLFLINPAGIIFGENASLDVGGSFFATTAESVVFGDDIEFSATQPQSAPLLTINITPGLQYGTNPSSINVSGSNLTVNAGQSISLLGGDVVISNSEISAPGGQVNLGGLAETGTIQIEGLTATFPENTTLGNLNLTNASTVDVTSTSNGTIAINAADFTMSGASEVLAGLTSGGSNADAVAGNITINATGDTNLTGNSLIANDLQTNAVGNGGNVELNTNSLSLTGGSRIQTVTNSTSASGEITIQANTGIVVDGFTDDGLFSGVLSRSATGTAGATGNITVNSPQNTLTLSNRGFIATVTNSSSNGGNIETNLNNLVIESGGQIITATTNLGNAGDITINATESVNISGESSDFVDNPFLNLAVFDLDVLEWTTNPNPNVEASDTIPYVSVERTPTQIINGTTILGTAETGVDYYSFSVTAGGSRAILDLDGGWTNTEDGTDVDSQIFLFNRGTGEFLATQSESTDIDPGSEEALVFPGFTFDTVIDTTLEEPGVYLLGVAAFFSSAVNNQLVEGATVEVGNTYTLNASVENQGTEGVSLPVDPFNPANYNPNIGANSSLLSETSGIGKAGNLTINTGQLIVNDGAQISADSFDAGIGGDITLNVTGDVDVSGLSLITSIAHSSGNAGNIAIDTGRLQVLEGGQVISETTSTGKAGDIAVIANESITVAGERTGTLSEIGNQLISGSTGDGGNIAIDTPILRLLDGGQVSSSIFGEGNGGSVNIRANLVEAIGDDAGGAFPSGILSVATQSTGNAANIKVVTDDLRLMDGAQIINLTRSDGNAGELIVRASNSVEILGQDDLGAGSGLATNVDLGGTGDGGNLFIEAELLRIADGGFVTASTLGDGNGGNLTVKATTVEISDGFLNNNGEVSGLNVSVWAEATGQGGNLIVEADSLRVFRGGQVTASTLGAGDAGSITLQVDEIEVSGISEDGEFVSSVSAFSETAFKAGSININSNNLTVSDHAQISVSNTGTGDAGNLNINADNISLDNQGSLAAEVTAGNQGNINLISQLLLLRNNSSITTNAGEQANGGNIIIDTVNLVALEDSDITANAIFGQGGNIIINTQGLFSSLDSEITASSEFGIDGVVEINTPDEENKLAIAELPTNFTDASQQIVGNCSWTRDNTFYVVGRRGIAKTPQEHIEIYQMWSDIRDLSEFESTTVIRESSPRQENTILEANAMIINEDGKVEFVAVVPSNNQNLGQVAQSCSGDVGS